MEFAKHDKSHPEGVRLHKYRTMNPVKKGGKPPANDKDDCIFCRRLKRKSTNGHLKRWHRQNQVVNGLQSMQTLIGRQNQE
jgi:hypothetical protein